MIEALRVLFRLRRRPFCFAVRRMRRVWRAADRHYDQRGRPVNLTIASSRARRDWADVLYLVMAEGALVRVRHQNRDEPAIMVAESEFRRLERRADSLSRPAPVDPEQLPDENPEISALGRLPRSASGAAVSLHGSAASRSGPRSRSDRDGASTCAGS